VASSPKAEPGEEPDVTRTGGEDGVPRGEADRADGQHPDRVGPIAARSGRDADHGGGQVVQHIEDERELGGVGRFGMPPYVTVSD
jgi:hypothetical protein